jgi:ADP-ribose pyrophosphatase YjhB (NUDIX family)
MLAWARELQSIAQSGLAWEPREYDRQRYEQVRRLAAERVADGGGDADRVEAVFAAEAGHATPKIAVGGVVFRGDELLLVQERAGEVWSLPGGWVDVGESPSEAVAREVLEESGYAARPVRLLGLYDRARHGFPPHLWHMWKALFLCELDGTEPRPIGYETLAAGFFARDGLPSPLRFADATRREIERCFEQREHPEWPTAFD